MMQDPSLIYKKVTRTNRLSGYINNIHFASSTELSYLVYNPLAKSCNLKIPYFLDNIKHHYYPDFIYTNTKNNKLVIVEIKGAWYNVEKVLTKQLYSEQFVQQHNNIYDKYEFIDSKKIKTLHLYHGLRYFNTIDSLVQLKKENNSLKIITMPESYLRNNNLPYTTKQELIDYINSL